MKGILLAASIVLTTLVFSAYTREAPGDQYRVSIDVSDPAVLKQDDFKASMDRGKTAYETYCLACHQADGKGAPGMSPTLVKTKWVLGDKKKLINILLNGMDEEIEVNGEIINSVMPAQAMLSDQEMADVLTYVRNSFGNKASAVTLAEVKKQRGK
ncbi:MAG: cytochrome c [Chitinophagaceae bacterium]|nr:cytochrome c [Chitinophagaceae bacterium]